MWTVPNMKPLPAAAPTWGFSTPSPLEINSYCDIYDLDTISVGTSIGFAMECFENNQITLEHAGGMDLSFGNRFNALELIHQMARGEGFGAGQGGGLTSAHGGRGIGPRELLTSQMTACLLHHV